MNILRDVRKDFRIIFAICILAFALSAGVRLLEYPRWDQPDFKVNGEFLLATHDAYYWVAGAEGVNSVAEPMPMAVLLKMMSRVFQVSPANLAFGMSIVLAALVTIPVALWAFFLGAPYAALTAAVIASFAPAFFTRTRLGFYDTDWATLFFPMLISWLLAVWIQPRLQYPKVGEAQRPSKHFDYPIPVVLILLEAFGLPWHNSIGIYLIGLLWLVAVLVTIVGRPGTRTSSFQTLIAIALPIGAGWLGALIGLTLLWIIGRFSPVVHQKWSRRIIISLLVVLMVILTGVQFQDYLSTTLSAYTGGVIGENKPNQSSAPLEYPERTASVRETQQVDLSTMLEGMAFTPAVGALGVFGFLLLLRRRPLSIFLLPLLLLGLGSIRLGARFTMFAVPVVSLGLLVSLDWQITQASKKYGWGSKTKILIMALAIIIAIPWIYRLITRLPVEPVLEKEHAEALVALGEIGESESTIWTWWDYGYASQHFARLGTFADGSRNSGEYLFTLGVVLGADDICRSAQLIRYAEAQGFEPWQTWDTWKAEEIDRWLKGLGCVSRADKLAAPQYLVVQWEALRFLQWIHFYGSWDFHSQEGERTSASQVLRPLELVLETGEFQYNEGRIISVATVDLLGDSDVQHYRYPENEGGLHLLVNTTTTQVMILDDSSYHANLVQLLIYPVDQLNSLPEYELLIDGLPFVRVFSHE